MNLNLHLRDLSSVGINKTNLMIKAVGFSEKFVRDYLIQTM
jgi:hypothetical protein